MKGSLGRARNKVRINPTGLQLRDDPRGLRGLVDNTCQASSGPTSACWHRGRLFVGHEREGLDLEQRAE